MLFLFEYRAARSLVMDYFPCVAAAVIVSFRVDSDVVSLATESPTWATSRPTPTSPRMEWTDACHRAQVHQLPLRGDLLALAVHAAAEGLQPPPRRDLLAAVVAEPQAARLQLQPRRILQHSQGRRRPEKGAHSPQPHAQAAAKRKDLHMFVWSSSASPAPTMAATSSPKQNFIFDHVCFACTGGTQAYDEYGRENFSRTKNGNAADEGGPTLSKLGSNSTAQLYPKDDCEGRLAVMPPASVMTRLILIMVWRKLIRKPNTYSSLIGIIWSLVSYMLAINARSFLKYTGPCLFMALQPRIIACGNKLEAYAMAVRFLMGAVLLHIAIVQCDLRDADCSSHHPGLLHPAGALSSLTSKSAKVQCY
ncbi:hypothetical protein HU200_021462 [Digitaria exilis]|uniref:Uncharacterized protein n=1 Tax=Digitaria exilis TaxID=1010633 RepID=A0A835K8V9_9POAL|nr:hypothetical protein HU200_021462 [Digitaria exilis]